jgi:hypothetical protein
MDRAAWNRAIGALRRVLGVGLSWVLVWFVILALFQFPDPESLTPGQMLRGLGLVAFLGIPFGVAHEIAGRGRNAGELSLVRTLVSAFLACALQQAVYLGYLEYRAPDPDFGLESGVQLALAMCVFGQFVTLVWYAVGRSADALFLRGQPSRLPGPLVLLAAIDFAVVLLACWLGNEATFFQHPSVWESSGAIVLTAAVTVVCFHGCGMYQPLERVGRAQLLAIAQTTAISFLIVALLLVAFQASANDDRASGRHAFPGLSLPMAFACLFPLTVASRLVWCGVMERLRRHRVS